MATLAAEMAQRLRLPAEAAALVEQAGRYHHEPVQLLEPETFERLMANLAGRDWRQRVGADDLEEPLPPEVRSLVRAIRVPPAGPDSEMTRLLADLVEVANLFCEQVEFLPFEYRTVEQIVDDIRTLNNDDFLRPEAMHALANLPRVRREDLLEIAYRLPVFPSTALRALAPGEDEEIEDDDLFQLASSDPTLAASLLRVANSSLYSPAKTISSIREAILSIGMRAARKVLVTSVLRPFLQVTRNLELWRHSLVLAQLAEQFAFLSGCADPREAFLVGLVHDAGRIPMEKVTGDVAAAWQRMTERGCEPVFIERVLCRFDHGELGGDILQRWNFPRHLAEAVRFHLTPECSDSPFPSLLYLAEYWSGSEEDLPSARRLKLAMERTRITVDAMQAAAARNGLLDSLINAV